jgi:NADP-dependent 3-hydroxy acid dehydrogenase YdfG
MIARNEANLREQALPLGPLAIALPCDVSDDRAVDHAIAAITATFGDTPDILVNNAGLFALAKVDELDPAAFRTALETNLVAPLRFVRAFLPAMRARRRGQIVTVGSIADRTVLPENASYASSKHGARALHEVLRLETRGSGVRATLVSPGPVDTPLWDSIGPDHRRGFTPRRGMLRPEAVADAVLYAVTQPADVNVDELRLSHA